MSSRVQQLLWNAETLDETDAINKVMASYHEELPFNSYMQNIQNMLVKCRYSQNLRYVPTSEQLRFIMSRAKYIAVVAAAGSGKTRTMTIRIHTEKENFNLDGNDVLAITFTKNSAKDMKKQYSQLCRVFGTEDDIEFKTIHKFGSDFISVISPMTKIITDTNPIKEWVQDTPTADGEYGEAREVEYKITDLLKQALEMCDIDTKVVTPTMFYNAISVIAEEMISSDKAFRETSEDYLDFPLKYEELMEIRKVYQNIKKNHGCIDFIDMLEYLYGTLKGIPELRRVQSANIVQYLTFKSIYIDEVQDVSPLQIAIVKELLRLNPECHLCVVGDDDQSIYGFRGADPSFLLNFADIFAPTVQEPAIIGVDEEGESIYEELPEAIEPVEIIYMTRNRRSAKKIIRVANLVVKHNEFRYDKEMVPMRSNDGEVNLIEDMHGMFSTGMILKTLTEEKNKGAGLLNHVGVLYREHKQVIPVLNMLVKNRIPMNCVYNEDSKYYAFNMFVTKDIIGIINMINELQNPTLVARYLYKLCPNISKQDAQVISDKLKEELRKPSKNRIKFSSIMKLNQRWKSELPRILNIYNLLNDDESIIKIVNTIYSDYSVSFLNDRLKDNPDLKPTVDMSLEYLTGEGNITWLNFLSRHTATKKWVKDNRAVNNGVALNSFHVSKGLEYDKVFILEVSDRFTPKSILLDKYSAEGRDKYIEEERRLFYVALTRAKNELTVFYNPEYSDSMFVKEMRDALETVNSEGVVKWNETT